MNVLGFEVLWLLLRVLLGATSFLHPGGVPFSLVRRSLSQILVWSARL
jgi:hypothetical protein